MLLLNKIVRMFVSRLCILVHFVLLIWENYAILEIKDSLKKKNLAFVESLKHDLRRNNDDYTSVIRYSNETQGFGVTNKVIAARRNNKSVDVRDKLIDKISRRVNDALKSTESNANSENNPQRRAAAGQAAVTLKQNITPFNNVSRLKPVSKKQHKIKQKNNLKALLGPIKLFTNISNEFKAPTIPLTVQSTTSGVKVKLVDDNQKQKKIKKLEKFKKFINKNQGLLREFIGSKMSSPPITLTTRRPKIRLSNRISESELRKTMREAVDGVRGRGKSLEELPNAELLDMAPAKGGRIHHKRIRGRLCHRHVLAPEGPKYGSAGRAYQPPHAARRLHEYNVTRAPRLLLPRCCNCCRKSVLGCH